MIRLLWILLAISLVPSGLMAAESIYTWGYGEQAHNVLKSVSMMTAGGGDYTLRFAAALGLFVFAFKIMVMGKDNTLQEITKYLLIVTVVGYMFWISKKQYIVEDQVDLYTSPAALNLPVGVGTTLSIFSGIEKAFGEGMEKYFSTPTSIGIMKQGLGFQMNVHLNAAGAGIQDSDAIRSFNEYIANCLLPAIDNGSVDSDVISYSDNLAADLKVNHSLLTNVYTSGVGATEECNTAWPKVYNQINGNYASILSTIAAVTPGGANATFATDVGQVFKTMYSNASNSAQAGIIQSALRNGLSRGMETTALATGGDAGNLAIAKAMTEQILHAGWTQAGIAAQKTLPMQKAVFTLVLMGLIVFLALMSIIFVTMQYIKTIFMLFAVLVMWNPIAAIINFLISLQMDKVATQVLVATGGAKYPSYMTNNVISATAADYMAFLGFFGTLIPMFAYMLVKGGDSIASHMYSSIASGMSMAARAGSVPQALGNIQTGNTQAGNRSFSNESFGTMNGFQLNSDGSTTALTRTSKGTASTTSNPATGSTQTDTLIGGPSSRGPSTGAHTEDSTGTTSLDFRSGNVVNAASPTAATGQVTEQYTQTAKEGYNTSMQKVVAAGTEKLDSLSFAVKDAKSEQEAVSILESKGVSTGDTSTILKALNYGKGTTSGSTSSFGNSSSTGTQTGDTTQVGIKGGVAAGAGNKGSGPSASAGADTAATHTQQSSLSNENTTGHQTSAGTTTSTSSSVNTSAQHQVATNKELREALSRVRSGTHSTESGSTDTLSTKSSEQYQQAYSELKGYESALSKGTSNSQDIRVAALNDYFDRTGIKGEANKQAEWERLSTSYANGNGANEKEWHQSLKNVAERVAGIQTQPIINDPSAFATQVGDQVKPAESITPPSLNDKPATVNPHLTRQDHKEMDAIYDKEGKKMEHPSSSPLVTKGYLDYHRGNMDTKEFAGDNNAAAIEKSDDKYHTNIFWSAGEEVVTGIKDDLHKDAQKIEDLYDSAMKKIKGF